MKVTAVIAEYNPIHQGHCLHLANARKDTGADYIIAVMSGNYVQRGCPSVISKYERARSALMAGADLVLELPIPYCTGSLEYFAKGAVSLISKTGLADHISFGSECGDISLLDEAADLSGRTDAGQDQRLKELLAEGVSYSHAINSILDLPGNIKELTNTPNNLLGIAYIRAAKELAPSCGFHTLKRVGAAYHDDSSGALSSSAIRRDLLNGPDGLHNISGDRMPDEIKASLLEYLKLYPPLSEDDFSLLLFYRLQQICEGNPVSDSIKVLTSYLDVSPALAGRIIKKYLHASSFSGLCDELKSKDLNRSRINRALLHILLGVRKRDVDEYLQDGYNYYIKPLGFKKDASDLLHMMKKKAHVPIISKNADAEALLAPPGLRMFNEGIKADDLYNKTACASRKRPFICEYERSPIILRTDGSLGYSFSS